MSKAEKNVYEFMKQNGCNNVRRISVGIFVSKSIRKTIFIQITILFKAVFRSIRNLQKVIKDTYYVVPQE